MHAQVVTFDALECESLDSGWRTNKTIQLFLAEDSFRCCFGRSVSRSDWHFVSGERSLRPRIRNTGREMGGGGGGAIGRESTWSDATWQKHVDEILHRDLPASLRFRMVSTDASDTATCLFYSSVGLLGRTVLVCWRTAQSSIWVRQTQRNTDNSASSRYVL